MSTRLLLVEDNDLNRDMLSRRLARAGFETVEAVDGEQALSMMREAQPALVLLDMNLPLLNGWQVCEQARQIDAIAGIPIIALTAHAMSEDRERALRAGCNDYATKPIDFPALLQKIERLLDA